MTNDKVYRATFEIVIEKQEELRQMLDKLTEEERPIKNEEERKKYLLLLSRSTLGTGTEEEINIGEHIEGGGGIIHNLEKTARWIAYKESKKVKLPDWSSPPSAIEKVVQIETLWKAIRDTLFAVFPRAVNLAVKSSPERFPQTKRKPDRV